MENVGKMNIFEIELGALLGLIHENENLSQVYAKENRYDETNVETMLR